jgi:hypothetical protein
MINDFQAGSYSKILVQAQIYSVKDLDKGSAYRYTIGAMGVECYLPPLLDGQTRNLVEVSDFMSLELAGKWIGHMSKTYNPLEEASTSIACD